MDGFTLVDGIVGGVIVVSAILAYTRGLVREVLAIGGWIVAAILGFLFAPNALPLVREIPVLGDFIGDSCELGIMSAFVAVFTVGLLLMAIFTPLFASAVQRSVIGGADAALGFLFGVARGVLLVVVALIAYDRIAGSEPLAMVTDSRSANIFAALQLNIEEQIPEDAPGWILQRYEQLMSACLN